MLQKGPFIRTLQALHRKSVKTQRTKVHRSATDERGMPKWRVLGHESKRSPIGWCQNPREPYIFNVERHVDKEQGSKELDRKDIPCTVQTAKDQWDGYARTKTTQEEVACGKESRVAIAKKQKDRDG